MSTKDEILARINEALADRPQTAPPPRDYHRTLEPGTDVVELFAQRAADYRATIHRTDAAGLSAAIAAAAGGHRLAVPAGIPPAWTAGLDTVADDPPLRNADLDGVARLFVTVPSGGVCWRQSSLVDPRDPVINADRQPP